MNNIKENVSLKNKTSFQIGGPAHFYIKIQTEDEIKDSLLWADENNRPIFILGKGSNILINDSGWPGLVMDITAFTKIIWEGTTAVCQSGAMLHNLVNQSVDKGFSGMEELAGIPGSIGGALVMNAGAFKQTVSDCLESVKGIKRKDQIVVHLKKSEIEFGYRTSTLKQNNLMILNAAFCFNRGDNKILKSVYSNVLKKRSEKQPLDLPNCGSIFKRPRGNYAGSLIEQCALKGYRIGGAMVSPKHANFIVNVDNAVACEVRQLIVYIQKVVYETKGILLEPEVIFVGEFDIPLYKP